LIGLVCSSCHKEYAEYEPVWKCNCGGFLDVKMEPQFPRKITQRNPDLWRYKEALPVARDHAILGEGYTPIIKKNFKGSEVYFKMEFLFPTGSFKDRGAAVLISKVKELGLKQVMVDSSGNAGAAIAGYCAALGIGCDVYVPADTPSGKVAQIMAYGAKLIRVNGTRQDTADLAFKQAQNTYYASHYWNPFFLQGTKTFAYEIWEQFNYKVPDVLVLPVGHGTIFLGAFIGFKDLLQAGMIDNMPRLIGVQTMACNPLVTVMEENLDRLPPKEAQETVAEGIAISQPLRWRQIIDGIRETGGKLVSVSEEEITQSYRYWSKRGLFIETTSAAVTAGLEKCLAQGILFSNELVTIPLTGSGLKAPNKVKFN